MIRGLLKPFVRRKELLADLEEAQAAATVAYTLVQTILNVSTLDKDGHPVVGSAYLAAMSEKAATVYVEACNSSVPRQKE